MRVPRWLVVVAGGVLVLALCPPASADAPTLAGTWTAGPVSESITVTSWVDECGPKPKAHALPGGGYKIIASGDELVFSGPQSFRTDVCFTQEDTKRVSHTATPALRTWKTRCESAPGDPRKASITTVVRAQSDDVIVLTESAHYSTTMASGTCSADVERARTFTIVAREGAATPSASVTTTASSAPPASSKSAPAGPACDSPGAPAVVEVRPKRKILRPGEQFDFKARVLDAAGCEVPSKLAFRLAPESSTVASIAVESTGRVKVHADAEPVAVAIVVEAAAITKTARVELEVVTDQRYQELLGTAGLDDAGIDDQAVAVVVSTSTDEATTTTVVPPRADDGRRRRFGWIAIAFGSGTLLALATLVFLRGRAVAARRARRSAPSAAAIGTLAIPPSTVAAGPSVASGATVVGAPDAPGTATSIRVCPSCGERYPADAAFCPIDGQRLVAVRDTGNVPLAPAPMAQSVGRICPVCGKRYPRDAGFCGQDGVELVPIN